MGPNYSTLIHYELIRQTIYDIALHQRISLDEGTSTTNTKLRVSDTGYGLLCTEGQKSINKP